MPVVIIQIVVVSAGNVRIEVTKYAGSKESQKKQGHGKYGWLFLSGFPFSHWFHG